MKQLMRQLIPCNITRCKSPSTSGKFNTDETDCTPVKHTGGGRTGRNEIKRR